MKAEGIPFVLLQNSIGWKINCNVHDGNVSADTIEKRFRSPNLTPKEKDLLISLIRKRLRIIECKKTDIVTQNKKSQEWRNVCDEFNAISGHIHRTPNTLRIAWDNWKKVVRKNWSLDKSGATMKKDPFISKVAYVLLETQELLKNVNKFVENASEDTVYREVSENEMIDIVKTDMLLSDDETCQNSNESHQCDDPNTSANSNLADMTSVLSPELTNQQTFSNLMSLSVCSPSQPVSCSSTVDTAHPSLLDKEACASLRMQEDEAKSYDTSTSIPFCRLVDSSSSENPHHTQHNFHSSKKLFSSSDSLSEDICSSRDSHDLQRTKVEAIKVMTKHSVEEHKMLQELFAVKMLQEKEKLEIERRKYDVENERLSQEKIKSQILLLQLEQLRRTKP